MRFIDKPKFVSRAVKRGDLILISKSYIQQDLLCNWEGISGEKIMKDFHQFTTKASTNKTEEDAQSDGKQKNQESKEEVNMDAGKQNMNGKKKEEKNCSLHTSKFKSIPESNKKPTCQKNPTKIYNLKYQYSQQNVVSKKMCMKSKNIDLATASRDDLVDIPGIDEEKAEEIIRKRQRLKTFSQFITKFYFGFDLFSSVIQYDVGLLKRKEISISFSGQILDSAFLAKMERKYFQKHFGKWERPNQQTEIMIAVLTLFDTKKNRNDLHTKFNDSLAATYGKKVDSFLIGKELIEKVKERDKSLEANIILSTF